nr:hypothetical protein [Sinorhizobium sp. A49]
MDTPMLEAGVKRSGRTIAYLVYKRVHFSRGSPVKVAALVAFLASEDAAFICGSLVEIWRAGHFLRLVPAFRQWARI